jgi:hypothetical protein
MAVAADASADGFSNGLAFVTENRFDCAFVTPASLSVPRSAFVDDWLAQSPRSCGASHCNSDMFWAVDDRLTLPSPSTRSAAAASWFAADYGCCMDDSWIL